MAISHDPVGTNFIGIWHRTLPWAVDELTQLDRDELDHLRVWSAEHIVAILLTAFLRRAPKAIDVDGGVDLLFDLTDQPPDLRTTVDLSDLAAFEIKSLPGDFRREDAQSTEPNGRVRIMQVQSAADIMEEAAPSLRAAASALTRKCMPHWSRNAFLVVHPFDHLALETIEDEIVAAALRPLDEAASLDLTTVWVLWFPDQLTMWSVEHQRWTEMNFRGMNPDEDQGLELDGFSVLQASEELYLERMGIATGSPYLFRLTARTQSHTER